MSVSPVKTRPPQEGTASASDVVAELSTIAKDARTKSELYRQGFRALARHFDAPYATLQADQSSGSLEERVNQLEYGKETFQKTCEGLALNSRYTNTPCGRIFESKSSNKRLCALAAPLQTASGSPEGVILIVTSCQTRADVNSRLLELRALVAMLSTKATAVEAPSRQAPATQASSPNQTGLARTAKYTTLHEFAFAMANSLKGKMACEQVSVGVIRNQRARLLCISGFDTPNHKSPGAKLIMQSMEECSDAGDIICFQADEKWASKAVSTSHRLHRAWHDESGNSPVASVPLMIDGKCHAVVSLRNPPNRPFRAEQLQKVQELAGPLGPGMKLLEKAERSLVSHALVSVRDQIVASCQPGGRLRAVAGLACVALLCFAVFGKQTYVVSVPCEVTAKEVRQFAAPFEGMIASVFVSPGDEVDAGQLLVQFNTDSIVVQRDAAQAELELAELEMTQATNEKRFAEAAQAQARLRMAESQLATAQHHLKLAEIRAPSDGIVLAGDLRPRVGETVRQGEPLMQFAPPRATSVELSVPENLAVYIRPGQIGSFSTKARPDESATCEIERMSPASSISSGKNVFVTTANTAETTPWLRTGMQGVARIETGKRPVWWVWLHGIVDSIRLAIWKL